MEFHILWMIPSACVLAFGLLRVTEKIETAAVTFAIVFSLLSLAATDWMSFFLSLAEALVWLFSLGAPLTLFIVGYNLYLNSKGKGSREQWWELPATFLIFVLLSAFFSVIFGSILFLIKSQFT